jgi:hypothetical protein
MAAFWADEEYDRDQASDGISRYGAYVQRSPAVRECWDGTWDDPQTRRARFAEAAWATATSPVMSPGYIRSHARVLRGRAVFNAWDATLAGVVDLVAPWPRPLAASRAWQGDGSWWRDWPAGSLGGREFYREPGEDETARYRYLMATARLVFPLAAAGLPAAPSGPGDDLTGTAREAVRVLVAAMNSAVAPVIQILERS